MKKPSSTGQLTFEEILRAIPHRYPFILVDGILESDKINYAIGYKNISLNDPYVYGCNPDKPRFPESLITECMCQVGAASILNIPENYGKIMLFAAIDNLRFYHPVFPGDRLISRVDKVYLKGNMGKMKATGFVNERLVAEGEFSYALTEK